MPTYVWAVIVSLLFLAAIVTAELTWPLWPWWLKRKYLAAENKIQTWLRLREGQ